jgi:hypothetical protein
MTTRKFLLPANLDQPAQQAELTRLVRKHHRRNLVTTGWIEDAYPDETDWVYQPDNHDPKRRIYHAFVHTRTRA